MEAPQTAVAAAAAGNPLAVSAAAADTHHPGTHSGPADSDRAGDHDIRLRALRHDHRGDGTRRCDSRGS